MTAPDLLEVCLWVTPKIFDDVTAPAAGVAAFFDHYADYIVGRTLTVVFCVGNGDHVLDYRGADEWHRRFDWARYNAFALESGSGADALSRRHNADWLARVREGGERSFNPYSAGPMMILSEQRFDYDVLNGIYVAFRVEAAARGIRMRMLEYLEPGPEFCRSEWKTVRHSEVAAASADAGGHMVPGVVDATLPLAADAVAYAAYPQGIPEGLLAGTFVAAQSAAFVEDFGLDGILLGNQFGLVGFWHPNNAPVLTEERRAGIRSFFRECRRRLGDRQLYWMDTYWRASVEREAWGMDDDCYATLDAIIVCTFAVLVERTEIEPNLRSKAELLPRTLYALDFVDPWYWYRTHLDDRRTYLYQRELLQELGELVDGVTFFANDTFGQFVPAAPLVETRAVVENIERSARGA